jgi:hypothetical protein
VTIAAPSRTAGLSLSTALAMYVLIALSYVVNSMDRSVFSNLVSAVNSEFGPGLRGGGDVHPVPAIQRAREGRRADGGGSGGGAVGALAQRGSRMSGE